MHWNYAIGERNDAILKHRINQLNTFWETGNIDYHSADLSLVYKGMSRDEVEKSALECIRGLSCSPQWIPKTESSRNRICVNYLRHRQSAYHLLLKQDLPYLKAFTLVNQAIASSYPWLIAEATLQIKKKSKKYE